MKIREIDIYHTKIPFKREFRHAESKRSKSGNLIVKTTLNDGTTGFGESVPRDYVTGETLENSKNTLVEDYIPIVSNVNFSSFEDCVYFMKNVGEIRNNQIVYNSAKCSLELSVLDAFGKYFEKSLSDIGRILKIEEQSKSEKQMRYSYVYSLGKKISWQKLNHPRELYWFGFRDFKFKLDSDLDYTQIDKVLEVLKSKINSGDVTLRVDANCSLNLGNAPNVVKDLKRRKVYSLEQPFKKGEEDNIPLIMGDIPIMLDESLCTSRDAENIIKNNYGDLFHLRISKNGGLINTLKIQQLAKQNNISYQLGCMVGETGILSAAQRHFLNIVPDVLFLEGSYGTHLLKEDVTRQNMTFGFGANPKPMNDFGLGIDVDENKLNKYSEKIKKNYF